MKQIPSKLQLTNIQKYFTKSLQIKITSDFSTLLNNLAGFGFEFFSRIRNLTREKIINYVSDTGYTF